MSSIKKQVMVSLDFEIWEKHRLLGSNISKICNDSLIAGLEDGINSLIKKTEDEKKQALDQYAKLEKRKLKDRRIDDIIALARKFRALGEYAKLNDLVNDTCKEFGFERAAFIARIDRAR